MPYLNRWFFAEVLEGIQQRSARARLRPHAVRRASPAPTAARRIFEDFLARKRFDGLIAVGLEPERPRARAAVCDRQAGRQRRRVRRRRRPSSRSTTTTRRGARPSTSSALGHRDIAFLGGGSGAHWAQRGSAPARRVPARRWRMPGSPTTSRTSSRTSTLPGGYAAAVDAARRCAGPPDGDRRDVRRGRDRRDHRGAAARHPGARATSASSGIDDHEYAEMFSLTTLRAAAARAGTRGGRDAARSGAGRAASTQPRRRASCRRR